MTFQPTHDEERGPARGPAVPVLSQHELFGVPGFVTHDRDGRGILAEGGGLALSHAETGMLVVYGRTIPDLLRLADSKIRGRARVLGKSDIAAFVQERINWARQKVAA